MVKIRLNEIPDEGRSYSYDRQTGELNEILKDLVGDEAYGVKLFIKPLGNVYDLKGEVHSALNQVCSNCGYDFKLPIDRNFHEILIEDQGEDRKAQSVHGNNSVDFTNDSTSMAFFRGDVFDAGDYIHEVVALAEPFYPMCGKDGKCDREDEAREIRARLQAEYLAAEEKRQGHPAFSVLKDLELSKKN